jgi:hypothetical protein
MAHVLSVEPEATAEHHSVSRLLCLSSLLQAKGKLKIQISQDMARSEEYLTHVHDMTEAY